ncbi:MAG: AI-2E family transporter [Anaerolineae bacterium]|nr:AI-2E family transporter [Anaerolineae bacterium]
MPDKNESAEQQQAERLSWKAYKRRLFLAVGLIAFLILFASFVDATLNVLMLLFLCVLLATGIRGAGDWLAERTRLSRKAAAILALVALLVLSVVAGLIIGPQAADQFSELGTALPEALRRIENELRRYSWGQALAEQIPTLDQIGQQLASSLNATTFARITGVFSTVLGVLSTVIVALFLIIFFILEPDTYIGNILHLVPLEQRERVHDTLRATATTLRKWLLTRVLSMLLVGALTSGGLAALGMPLTLSLGIIAAIGAFIPTFGPILALIPAVLVALLQSPQDTLWVVALYTAVQMIDNYLVAPILERSMLYLPPAYIITAQLVLGVLAGPFGLVLAAPIAAALVIVVRKLYVEDVLGDRSLSARA